jgi:hypothetical protein
MTKVPWHRLIVPLALLRLNQFRESLRQKNLHDTSQLPNKDKLPKPLPDPQGRHLTTRTFDGSFNDLEHPEMGMIGTRFGRNVPLKETYPDENNLMKPNPRTVSRTLMTRDEFIPATTLNILAAAWIQFQNHDWFVHKHHPTKKLEIPLEEGDPWPQEYRPLAVAQTEPDPSRLEGDKSGPPTFISDSTHWWDGSQIYGYDEKSADKLRSHIYGKLTIGDDGLLPLDPEKGVDQTGSNDNWWVGLSLLHTVFFK